jgi:hypothetical protein
VKYSEIEKKVKKAGCYFVRNGKKHPIWFSPITGKEFQLMDITVRFVPVISVG